MSSPLCDVVLQGCHTVVISRRCGPTSLV